MWLLHGVVLIWLIGVFKSLLAIVVNNDYCLKLNRYKMGNLIIPEEADFRRWIREEIETVLKISLANITVAEPETIYTRKEAARLLNISLVTLTDWMKRDLPFHKQRGRVYFLRSELMEFIKRRKLSDLIF